MGGNPGNPGNPLATCENPTFGWFFQRSGHNSPGVVCNGLSPGLVILIRSPASFCDHGEAWKGLRSRDRGFRINLESLVWQGQKCLLAANLSSECSLASVLSSTRHFSGKS